MRGLDTLIPFHADLCFPRVFRFQQRAGSRERLVQDMPWLEKCSVTESNAHAAICEGSSGVYEVSRNGRTANVIATKDYTYMWPGFFGGEVAAMRYLFQN